MTLADCTVMVVEDHEFQRRTTLQILANLGAGGLLEAADGEGALALLAADPRPDIVICDLDMPGMDGVEFLRHVAGLGDGTAIVIASGLDDSVLRSAEATARGYGLEVLGAIGKPLTARRCCRRSACTGPGAAPDPAARLRGQTAPIPGPRPCARAGSPVRPPARRALVGAAGRARGPRAALSPQEPATVDAAATRSLRRRATAAAIADAVARSRPRRPGVRPASSSTSRSSCRRRRWPPRILDRLAGWRRGGIESRGLRRAARRARRVARGRAAGPAHPPARARLRPRHRRFGAHARRSPSSGIPLTRSRSPPGAARARPQSTGGGLRATVQALRDQGLDVVCDGCDSQAEWALALHAGCRRAQGELIGPALAPEEVAAGCRAGRRRDREPASEHPRPVRDAAGDRRAARRGSVLDDDPAARDRGERTDAEHGRVTSFRLSDQMRQTSNDLTRMVRLYVPPAPALPALLRRDPRDPPRRRAAPAGYDSSFWDRVLADGEAAIRRGPAVSLTELMRRARSRRGVHRARRIAARLRPSRQLEQRVMDAVAPRIGRG